MKPTGASVSSNDARALVDGNLQPITRTKSVRIDDALGRVLSRGSPPLNEGTVLDAPGIGVLASHGLKNVEVYVKPKVAVIPFGDEIVPLGRKLKKGQCYDINTHTVAAVVNNNGGEAYSFQAMGERADIVRGTVAEALQFDLIVISDGSSKGETDLLTAVLDGWGRVLFNGVRTCPREQIFLSIVDGKPVVAIPGSPALCLLAAHLLVLPAVRKMAHLPPCETVSVPLGRKVRGGSGCRFLTVKIRNGEVVSASEPDTLTGIANADGYIEIPENTDGMEKGKLVAVTLF